MRGILIGTLLWLAVVFPVCGKSTILSVTPEDRNGVGQFVFVMTSSPASNGFSFHVTITPKQGEVPADSDGHLCTAELTKGPKHIGPLTRDTQVALKPGKPAWSADFVASEQVLSNPDACFVFTVWWREGPSADFYVLKLRDFATRYPHSKLPVDLPGGTNHTQPGDSKSASAPVTEEPVTEELVRRKLETIRLPVVTFKGASLDHVIIMLSEMSKTADPDHQGINIIWCTHPENSEGEPLPAGVPQGADLPFDPNAIYPSSFVVSVEPQLVNQSLKDVLNAIVRGANPRVHFTVNPYAVVFWPNSMTNVP